MAPIFVKGFPSSQGPFLDSQNAGDVVLIFGEDFSSFQRSMLDFNDCHGRSHGGLPCVKIVSASASVLEWVR